MKPVASRTLQPALLDVPPCTAKVPVKERDLIDIDDAQRIEGLFKILANATRLRLLHVLIRESELCVMALAEAIGMKPQAVSNQLQRLVDRGILGWRRQGNLIFYRIVDPCIVSILDHGLCLSEDALNRRSHEGRSGTDKK